MKSRKSKQVSIRQNGLLPAAQDPSEPLNIISDGRGKHQVLVIPRTSYVKQGIVVL
jgi:hypothetical protein